MVHVLDAHSPIDGDPDRIERHSGYYRDIAAAIESTARNLASVVSTADTTSTAIDAFVEVAAEVRGSLTEADERYVAIATQLSNYATQLRTLQADAASTMADARNAYEDHDATQWRIETLRDHIAATAPTDPGFAGLHVNVRQQEDHLAWIGQVVSGKDAELQALLESWRAVADTIAHAIRDAVDGSPLNDSGWDKFLDLLETVATEILPIIETVMDILALVLTIAAFILAVTGVGAPLAAALFTVARVAQLVSKIAKIARVTITVLLVVTGKKPAAALADVAGDMALDKAMGAAMDGLGDAALRGAKYLPWGTKGPIGELLSKGADREGSLFLTQHLDQLVHEGFDEWANTSFKEFMDVGMAGLPAGSDSFFVGTDSLLGTADHVLDGYLKAWGLELPEGPDLAYGASDLRNGWDVIDTALDVSGAPEYARDVPDMPADSVPLEERLRPSAVDLIGASR